ncbi:rho GTPase-activating protein gacH-like [Chironomus tepperi]|uniref:rho GTPase-activating protein gacH-like n=1 Tax=Chironomus tepperi TaxID=113505 RepID=UPI00391F1767
MFNSKVFSDSENQNIVEFNSDDHIYENVTTKYNKYGILNGILSGFTSKAKDFNLLPRKRDKYTEIINECPSPMNEFNFAQFSDDMSIFERNFEYQMDYQNSYTSCEDDNIYENLEFFCDENFNNSSLNNWMLNLTMEVEEYDSENIMFVKSIPSVFSVKRKTLDFHRKLNRNQITLNFLKILWNRENNVDIMSLLLQTFANLLRDQNKQSSVKCNSTDCSSLVTKISTEKVSLKKLKKSKKKIDKNKIYQQKFENVILSSSLNILVITYNKSQKFYFLLAYSEILFKLPTGVKLNQIIYAIKNNYKFNFRTYFEEIEFFKYLRRLLNHKLKQIQLNNNVVDDSEEAIENNSENIYQQIWTCQSISNDDDKPVIINSENIYSSLDYARVDDDNEWEVDHEFSFMNAKVLMTDDKMMNQNNYYKTIWVYYNEENPDYNRIFYDSLDTNSIHTLKKEDIKRNDIIDEESIYSDAISLSNDVVEEDLFSQVYRNLPNDVKKCEITQSLSESVDAWKALIRAPNYCEDEEDFFVNESILSSNFSYYTDVENDNSQSVNVHSSNFSLQLDDSPPATKPSRQESYRSLTEEYEVVDKPVSPPKTPRERGFRDRVKSKLKIKSGKAEINKTSIESLASITEDELVIFGGNLEKVEKDNYHKNVPKIIVDCISILELDVNIKTPGIYRISGNKNTIDAIKKKFNEKKQSKKESRHAMLQDQDVHTLTGLLKMFFRELKPPLMTKQIFTQCTSEKHSASQMWKIIREMPIQNYATLKYLFRHFKTIEKYQNENLMNSGNLAICLGLCLFSNSFGEVPNPYDNDISKCNMLCKYLIDNYNDVFESFEEAS